MVIYSNSDNFIDCLILEFAVTSFGHQEKLYLMQIYLTSSHLVLMEMKDDLCAIRPRMKDPNAIEVVRIILNLQLSPFHFH